MSDISLNPNPDQTNRHKQAKKRREAANKIAENRIPQTTSNNGEIAKYDCVPTNFHKGIPHDEYGIPDPKAFKSFVKALNRDDTPLGNYASFDVPLGPIEADDMHPGDRDANHKSLKKFHTDSTEDVKVRNWESPLGGHAFDLQGPDAGDLAMAPAPTLISSELTAEMAEVYALALIRDVPFEKLDDPEHPVKWFKRAVKPTDSQPDQLEAADAGFTIGELLVALNKLTFFKRDDDNVKASFGTDLTNQEHNRRQARFFKKEPALSGQSIFRGSVPGAKDGPYISQFLLIGSGGVADNNEKAGKGNEYQYNSRWCPPLGNEKEHPLASGYITFGAQRIDQRVDAHLAGRDHMTEWPLWLDVQNGAKVNGSDSYFNDRKPRFIGRPRDLATYVHFDQLYQAYFNACLLLFDYKVPFDQGFPSGAHVTRGSFATFGSPHILSLMTEVASRALKAVRRQKFQHHLRGRPEQLAAMLTLAASNDSAELGNAKTEFHQMLKNFSPNDKNSLLTWINSYNEFQNTERKKNTDYKPRSNGSYGKDKFCPANGKNYLLPMAFPEGSPMHAAYGAGHATVAGACVTILKAFFELSVGRADKSVDHPAPDDQRTNAKWWKESAMSTLGITDLYQAPNTDNPAGEDHSMLKAVPGITPKELTITGELNKLAANIAIGRNMGGVHFYTDYYDSLRMGERLAIGILEEQMTTYVEPVSMRLRSFDDDAVLISGDGKGNALVEIGRINEAHNSVNFPSSPGKSAYEEWWNRHVEPSTVEPPVGFA